MNSINKKEIEKFSKIAEEWWDPNGKFKPLHNFNPIRIRYIKENIINILNINPSLPLNPQNTIAMVKDVFHDYSVAPNFETYEKKIGSRIN